MIARVFDSKHQAYFCLPKPCPFGECGEDSCCPSSFSPALCEATVLISSAPHICPASALAPCREWTSCSRLLSRALFGKWTQVSAAPGGSSLSQVFSPAPSAFLLPSPSSALFLDPVHIFVEVFQHGNFLPSLSDSFCLPQLDASGLF